MIFQPNGGAGGGGGLTVYNGTISNGQRTFKTPVKFVFVSKSSGFPLWYIVLPGKSQYIYAAGDTWPPTALGDVMLSADGKTLSTRDRSYYLYYAIG